MGVRYDNMKLVWLKQAGGKTTTIAWVSPDEGSLGAVSGGQKVAIPVKVRVINGPAPVFTLADGQLPPGLTFDTATGAITGMPENLTGDYSFTLRATSGEATVERAFQIAVATNAPPVWTTPSGSLGSPFDSTDYTYTLEAVDPEGQPVTFSLVTGSLPGGLKLDPTTGEITGRLRYVSANTTFYFTVRASDGLAATNESFNITVKANEAPYWVSNAHDEITRFVEHVPHSFQFEAVDPEGGELTYSIVRGNLPEGITLSPSGVLSGTLGEIVSNRTTVIGVLATDGIKGAERSFTIAFHKNVPPVWTAPVAPFEEVSGYVATIPFHVADPNGQPVTVSVKEGETLPAGFSIIDNTIIGEVPMVESNTDYSFTLVATDGVLSAERTVVLRARPNTPPVWTTASDLGETLELKPMSRQLVAVDPEGKPLTYTASSDLPVGLNLSTSGVLSGTPVDIDEDTTFEFSVEVSDGVHTVERDFSLLIKSNVAPVWQTPAGALGAATAEETFEVTLLATDANGDPLSYALTAGQLPPGLTLRGNRISGIAAILTDADQNYEFTITASDGAGHSVPRAFSILHAANKPLVWVTEAGRQGEAFEKSPITFTVQAADPEGKKVNYRLPRNGRLPEGFSLNPETGAISGTIPSLTQDVQIGFTIVAYVQGQDDTAWISRSFNVLGKFNTAPEFTSPLAMRIVEDRASVLKITAKNSGNGPMVYTVVSGALPTGLTLQSNGTISGFAPAAATDTEYTFTVRAHNGIKSAEQAFTITVEHNVAPVWTTDAGSLGTVFAGATRVFSPKATDGNNQPVFYSLVSGALPTGLSLAPATGVISGVPEIAGDDATSTFTLGASDGVLRSDRTFSITVSANTAPTWTTPAGSLGEVVRNKNFSIELKASDNESKKLTYSIIDGALPQGILLDPNTGALVGRAPDVTQDEIYTFTVRASDGALFADREFSIAVNMDAAPIWNTPASLGSVLSGYSATFSFSATDPEGLPIAYTMVSGTLPQGWAFDAQNARIETPENGSVVQTVDETFNFTIRASDGQVFTDRQFSVTVLKNLKPTWNAAYNTNLGSITERSVIDFTVVATDPEDQGVNYSVTAGALPTGITLNPTTGQVSGTLPFVEEDTDFAFTIQASDSRVSSDPLNYTLRVLFDSPPIWQTAAGSLGTALEDTDVSYTVAASSNGGVVTYGLKYGSVLPTGLSIDPTTGVISGKLPLVEASSQNFSFTLTATNAAGKVSERVFSITVQDNVAPVWQTPGGLLISDLAGTAFSFTLLATDGNNTPLTYSVVEGELPSGVTFDPETRVLSGALPTVAEDTTYIFSIGASDGNIRTDREFRLRSLFDTAPVWVTAADLGTALEMAQFSITLSAVDGQGKPVTYSLKEGSSLPGTLTLTGSPVGGQTPIPAGHLSGRLPANDVVGAEDTYTFTVVASDGTQTSEREFTLKVKHNTAPVWTTAAGSLGMVVEGQIYSQTLVATDPDGKPVTYALATGSTLPPGLSLNATTGVISGSAGSVTTNTTFPFTVEATDDLRTTARAFAITVNNAEAPVDNFSNNVILLMQMNGSHEDNTGKLVYPTNTNGRAVVWTTNRLMNDAGDLTFGAYSGIREFGPSQTGSGGLDFTNGGSTDGKSSYVQYDSGSRNSNYLTRVIGNDFTMEAWFKAAPRATENQTVFSHYKDLLVSQYRPGVGMVVLFDGALSSALTIAGDFADDNWHHVAITRSGNIYRHFVDGVEAPMTLTSASAMGNEALIGSCYLGNSDARNTGLNGQIDNFRVVIGEALYTSAFAPSSTLQVTTGPTTTDENAKTDFGHSLKLVAGQGLAIPHYSDFVVTSGDSMTYEAWIRADDDTTNGAIFSKRDASLISLGLYKEGGQFNVSYYYNNTQVNLRAGAVTPGVWQHVAVVISRTSSHTIKLYVDGVEVTTNSVQNGGLSSILAPMMIGTDINGQTFLGHIDEVRFTRAARYTSNFIPAAIQTDAIPKITTKFIDAGYEMQTAAYEVKAVDVGNSGSITYSQTGLGTSLVLSPTTGQITGTNPDSTITAPSFTLTATDAKGNKQSRVIPLRSRQVTAPSAIKYSWRFNDAALGVSTPVSIFQPNVGSALSGNGLTVSGARYAAAPNRAGEFALNVQSGYVYQSGIDSSAAGPLGFMNTSEDFTVEGWFHLTAAVGGGAPTIISMGGNNLRFFVDIDGLGMTHAGTILTPRMIVGTGSWHHLAVVRRGTETKVYLNGTLWQTLTAANIAVNEVSFGTVGGSTSSNFMFSTPTYLRDWTVYNQAKYLAAFTPRWKPHHDPMWLSETSHISSGFEGEGISAQLVAETVEGRTLTYTSSNMPEGVTLTPSGQVGGVYPAATTSFTVTATDSTGAATPPRTFDVIVTEFYVADPYALYTRNLFTMAGADGSAPVDARNNAAVGYITKSGSQVAIRSSVSKWGSGAASFSDAHLNSTPYGTDQGSHMSFANTPILGSDDFTIEAWIYPVAPNSGSSLNYIWSSYPASSGYTLCMNSSRQIVWNVSNGVATSAISEPIALLQWHHVAISRQSGVLRLFVNGVKQGSDYADTSAIGTDTTIYHLGGFQNASFNGYHIFKGFINDFRFTHRRARYTTNFAPPTQALGIEGINGVVPPVLAWTFNKPVGTLTAAVAVPDAGYGANPTVATGNITLETAQRNVATFARGQKVQMTTSDLTFMTDDFTFETWINPRANFTSSSGNPSIVTVTTSDILRIFKFDTGPGHTDEFVARYNGVSAVFPSEPQVQTWSHVAVVKSGNTMTAYINGVAGTPVTVTAPTKAALTNVPVVVNGHHSGANWSANASYCDFGFSRYAKYSGNFTPPAAPPNDPFSF